VQSTISPRRTAARANRKRADEHWLFRIVPPVFPYHFHTCVEIFAPRMFPAKAQPAAGRTAPGADWRTPHEHGMNRISLRLPHRHFHIFVEIFIARTLDDSAQLSGLG
jgi:hypothetical protein